MSRLGMACRNSVARTIVPACEDHVLGERNTGQAALIAHRTEGRATNVLCRNKEFSIVTDFLQFSIPIDFSRLSVTIENSLS